ncbi:hypothetical protein MYIN104542_27295 [Mycobacterium intermedium]
MTKQSGRSAGPTIDPGCAAAAIAAIAEQDATRPTGLSRAGCAIGTVTDKWPSENRICGRINQSQQLLLNRLQGRRVQRFGGCKGLGTPAQSLYELLVKQACLLADRLILPTVGGKQFRECQGHLIVSRSRHLRRRSGRSRISGLDR